MERRLDAAIEKVVGLAKEPEHMKDVERVESLILETAAEPEFQYGAEAFEEKYSEFMSRIMKEQGKDSVAKGKKR